MRPAAHARTARTLSARTLIVRARHQGIQQQRGVGGGAGERSGNHELRGIARAFPGRHQPTSGLQPDQPACRGRDPHGAPAVGPGANGNSPAATAAALPPEEPPELRLSAYGLRDGGAIRFSL